MGEGDGDGEGDGRAGFGDGGDGAAVDPPAGAPAGFDVAAPAGADVAGAGVEVAGMRPQPVRSTIDSTSHRVAFSTSCPLVEWAALERREANGQPRRIRG